MNIAANKKETLEILISTMNRKSLSFLEAMFPHDHHSNFQLLVINQTQKGEPLLSDQDHIRVINSFETGLPHSRNLAIQNAKGDYCLIADDDVCYKEGFASHILEAFRKYEDADLITFQMVDETGKLFKDYPEVIRHDKRSITKANSVVIAFKPASLKKNHVHFNTNFGLGAIFPTANEYVFMRNALKANLKLYFEPKVILSHPFESSGKNFGSDKMVFSRAALFYKYSGILGYLRLCKYLYLVYMRDLITIKELWPKFKQGHKGIKTYKKLIAQGLEKR
ncbi:MAG: glycosyltransferase family 2 protein [Flavobacteriaceae bacterium]|nr:glycosyltransferase family 2 protein [Flavobacteriaceae bacterium]NNL32251.1 glycosyltransferase family 2 protein [Flavobacteriaceae bacterium]